MTKIILLDDHQLFLEGLELLLSNFFEFELIKFNKSNEYTVESIAKFNPDLLITDINMDGMDGIEILKRIKTANPLIKVLLLSVRDDNFIIHKVRKLEADGYLSKNAETDFLISVVEKILNGEKYFPTTNNVREKFMNKVKITPREYDVLRLIVIGKTIKEVANILFLAESTVISHKKSLFEKTQTRSLVELVNYALNFGLV